MGCNIPKPSIEVHIPQQVPQASTPVPPSSQVVQSKPTFSIGPQPAPTSANPQKKPTEAKPRRITLEPIELHHDDTQGDKGTARTQITISESDIQIDPGFIQSVQTKANDQNWSVVLPGSIIDSCFGEQQQREYASLHQRYFRPRPPIDWHSSIPHQRHGQAVVEP